MPYDEVFSELEDINNEFSTADVAVIGANDVTNPLAKTDRKSSACPSLDVETGVSSWKRAAWQRRLLGVDNEFLLPRQHHDVVATREDTDEIVKAGCRSSLNATASTSFQRPRR